MNIAQVSRLEGRGQALLAKMIEVAPLLQHAEFKIDASTHLVIPDTDTFSGSAARAEGASLTRNAQSPIATSRNLALYGREISIDDVRKLDANVGVSPAGLRLFADRRLAGLAGKLATEIQNQMFTGSDATNEMLGLGVFVKDAASGGQTAKLGFTTAQLAAMNTQIGLQLNTTVNQDSFVELLEKELAAVPGANAIIVNTNLGARLSSIARRIGAAGETINSFGTKVQTFDGIPIVRIPTSALPQTETDGTLTTLCSLYIVRFAEDLGVSFSTNSGFYFTDFPESEVGPSGISRLQFFLNLTVERSDAMKRLSRIQL